MGCLLPFIKAMDKAVSVQRSVDLLNGKTGN